MSRFISLDNLLTMFGLFLFHVNSILRFNSKKTF